MPSPPLSNVSAWIVPGSAIGVPLYGVDTDMLVSRTQSRLPTAPEGAVSNTTRITCAPAAGSVTVADTVLNVCHPPVSGIVSAPVTLTPPNSTWNVPPCPADATRASRRYEPADATLTLYLSHSPGSIHPTR